MQPLSQADILGVWEEGEPRHALDRALLPLAAALPDWSWRDLASLSVGRRDGLLLRLRECTLGSRLEMLAACPRCRELVEFEADTRELMVSDPYVEPTPPARLALGDQEIALRRLDSHDLAEAVAAGRSAARSALARAAAGGARVDGDGRKLATAAAEADPQADLVFGLDCPSCGHAWRAVLDIADYFWREITGLARRLLDEVQELAAHYGWSEAEVVAMSPVRRRHYLERARR